MSSLPLCFCKMKVRSCCCRVLLLTSLVVGLLLIIDSQILGSADDWYPLLEEDDYFVMVEEDDDQASDLQSNQQPQTKYINQSIPHPILVWWTPFTREKGRVKKCGNVKCFTTDNRDYWHHENTSALFFYGTDLKIGDLPIPRLSKHEWALLHEESPKNIYLLCHEDSLALFNHTSTYRRESDFPLTTLYLQNLDDLTSRKYYKTVAEKNKHLKDLALMNYIHSDCNAPSDRDHLVQMLQRHLTVDSYGACLHNRDLPKSLQDPLKTMESDELYEFLSRYKFSLSFENAVGDDYITEKFWRPFITGSVPIIFGSPKAKDMTPDNHSAIFVSDYANVEDLVSYLLHLNQSDSEYEAYLKYKTNQGITNTRLKEIMHNRVWSVNEWPKPSFVDAFECGVCERIHDNLQRKRNGLEPKRYQANVNHYGCPRPQVFSDEPLGNLTLVNEKYWSMAWTESYYVAKALRRLAESNTKFTKSDVLSLGSQLKYNRA